MYLFNDGLVQCNQWENASIGDKAIPKGNILGNMQRLSFSAIIVELGTMIHWIMFYEKVNQHWQICLIDQATHILNFER